MTSPWITPTHTFLTSFASMSRLVRSLKRDGHDTKNARQFLKEAEANPATWRCAASITRRSRAHRLNQRTAATAHQTTRRCANLGTSGLRVHNGRLYPVCWTHTARISPRFVVHGADPAAMGPHNLGPGELDVDDDLVRGFSILMGSIDGANQILNEMEAHTWMNGSFVDFWAAFYGVEPIVLYNVNDPNIRHMLNVKRQKFPGYEPRRHKRAADGKWVWTVRLASTGHRGRQAFYQQEKQQQQADGGNYLIYE